MANIYNKMKVNVNQGYIDGLIDEFMDKGDKAFFYDETNIGEINKEDSRLVSLAIATLYTGDDIKSLAQKMVVNKNRITYNSADIYGSENVGDKYSFDISVNVSDLYNFLYAIISCAELREIPFNISVPRPQQLSEGLKKAIQVYSDDEHLEYTYNMLASLLNVTRRKCKGNIKVEFPVHKWLSLDVKVDDQYLSTKIADIVKAACSEFSKEELEDEDKKNVVRESILQGLRDLELPYLMISDDLSFAESGIELTMPIPVIEKIAVTDAMSDEFIQATGRLDPSEVLALMQAEEGMADAAEASIEGNTYDDKNTRELKNMASEVEEVMSNAPVQEDPEEAMAADVLEKLNADLDYLDEHKEEQLGLTSQISDLTTEIAKLFGDLNEKKEEPELPGEELPEIDFDEAETTEDGVDHVAVGATDEDIEGALKGILGNNDDLASVETDDEVYAREDEAAKPTEETKDTTGGTPVIPDEFATSEITNLSEDLTEEERSTLVDSSFVVDEKNKDLMAKYSLVSTDPRFFGLQLQLPNGESLTVLDYLEENKILDKIPLDSVVETPDGEKISGADFIRRIVPDYVYRYSSLDEIIETFTTKITPKENGKVRSKGLLGRFIK